MISFAWPWVIVVSWVPLLMRYLPPRKKPATAALRVPSLHFFQQARSQGLAAGSKRWSHLLAWLFWVLLVAACMRPQWLGEPLPQVETGRDLMLGIDISGSMSEEDFIYAGQRLSRLEMVKALGRAFIQQRRGDRVGLILFGERAYVQTPLTYDRNTVQHFLGEAVVGLAGKATAIGDAIGLSLKRLRKRPEESRVLVLLTDGANTAGRVSPLDAAEQAARLGVRIYTIGVGSDATNRRGIFGIPFGSSGSDLDEASLRRIAEVTGGRYFRAKSTEELEQIYALIDKLEPTQDDTAELRPLRELYIWPLGAALVLMLLAVAVTVERQQV